MGLILVSPKKIIFEKSLRLGFSATNNEYEYEALLIEMAMVQKMGGRTVEVVRTHVIHLLETCVTTLCNWLIL